MRPNSKLEGNVTGSIGTVSHASQPSYTMGGMLNIPLGDTLAFRGSVKPPRSGLHRCLWPDAPERGFGDRLAAARQSADPVNSSGIYYNKKDWNWQTSLTTRGAGLAAGRQASSSWPSCIRS
jgi:hypothetical protein